MNSIILSVILKKLLFYLRNSLRVEFSLKTTSANPLSIRALSKVLTAAKSHNTSPTLAESMAFKPMWAKNCPTRARPAHLQLQMYPASNQCLLPSNTSTQRVTALNLKVFLQVLSLIKCVPTLWKLVWPMSMLNNSRI